MNKKGLELTIEIPKEIAIEIVNGIVKVKGPKGEIEKKLFSPRIKIEKKDNQIILTRLKDTKHEKEIINTFCSHIRNLIKGALNPYVYKLKVCSSHFPMNISVAGSEVIIKNFVGEKAPRKAKILDGVHVKVDGDVITVDGCNKESTGQTAANIEKACKRPGFDTRVFQDGIYQTVKAGKVLHK